MRLTKSTTWTFSISVWAMKFRGRRRVRRAPSADPLAVEGLAQADR
jgi:hypothetical protein